MLCLLYVRLYEILSPIVIQVQCGHAATAFMLLCSEEAQWCSLVVKMHHCLFFVISLTVTNPYHSTYSTTSIQYCQSYPATSFNFLRWAANPFPLCIALWNNSANQQHTHKKIKLCLHAVCFEYTLLGYLFSTHYILKTCFESISSM